MDGRRRQAIRWRRRDGGVDRAEKVREWFLKPDGTVGEQTNRAEEVEGHQGLVEWAIGRRRRESEQAG